MLYALAALIALSSASTADLLSDESAYLQTQQSHIRLRQDESHQESQTRQSNAAARMQPSKQNQTQNESLDEEVEEANFHQEFVATIKAQPAAEAKVAPAAQASKQKALDSNAGDPACPCVEATYPKNATAGENVLVYFELPGGTGTSTVQALYPADLGSTCSAWDNGVNPQCQGDVNPSWCAEPWCYVDLCNCDLDVMPKHMQYVEGATYDGKALYYSYRTCGVIDVYSATENDLACPNHKSEYECGTQEDCVWSDTVDCVHKDYVTECGYVLHSSGWRSTARLGLLSFSSLMAAITM